MRNCMSLAPRVLKMRHKRNGRGRGIGFKGLGETREGDMLIVILQKCRWETRFVVVDDKEK